METTDLIAQALDNLVKQFANPMDFLRELIQNSIDAGSSRIEVELRYRDEGDRQGVVEVEVRDFGQGMDEDVIDSQLTRLFSSAKEGDRTAIGKFGIGFTSVFAIRPDAVRVLTGKHGESWEVLFHADRSFEKRRYDGPLGGTTITLYKRLRPGKVAELVANARKSLVHWCEHATTPIVFLDHTIDTPTRDAPASEDVFAVFEEEHAGETINRPFQLEDAWMQVRHERDGIVAVVGFCPSPSWSFFSGGLTLLRSTDPGHLARYEADFAALSFKILSPRVGHTLSRDSVTQDENWHEAMAVASEAAVKLRAAVVEHMTTLAAAGDVEPLCTWQERLVHDLQREALDPKAAVFLDPLGRPTTLSALQERSSDREIWRVDPLDSTLATAMSDAVLAVILDRPEPADLLARALPDHQVAPASGVFTVCEPLDDDALSASERALADRAEDMAAQATLGAFHIALCDLGPHTPLLFVEGRQLRGLYRVPERTGYRGLARRQLKHWQTWLGKRWILVNRRHPHVRFLLSTPDPDLAAYALVEALMVEDAGFPRSSLQNLRSSAVRRWVTHGS